MTWSLARRGEEAHPGRRLQVQRLQKTFEERLLTVELLMRFRRTRTMRIAGSRLFPRRAKVFTCRTSTCSVFSLESSLAFFTAEACLRQDAEHAEISL